MALSSKIINEQIKLDTQLSDIDWMHHIVKKDKPRKKGWAIIIKFTKSNLEKKFPWKKENLKEQINLLQKVWLP